MPTFLVKDTLTLKGWSERFDNLIDSSLFHQSDQRVFDGITETLVQEGRIELRNFGVFEVKQRQPRTARNPRTREEVMVPARMVVTFKPGREMEKRVGQLKKPPNGKA